MRKLSFLFCLCLMALPFSANAQGGLTGFLDDLWGDSLRDHVANYTRPDDDTFVSTMMAVCEGDNPKVKNKGLFEEVEFDDVALTNGKLKSNILYLSDKVRYRPSRNADIEEKFVPKKAPLFIYFPGAFGKLMNDQAKRFFRDMNELGYHVATFSSPLDESFIKLGPTFKPGDFMKEAQILHRALQNVVDHVDDQGLFDGNLYLAGVSYGAFMASIVTNLDHDNRNLINGGTTLISPPADYGISIGILDKYIDETRDDFAGLSFSTKYSRYLTVCRRHSRRLLKKYAKGLTVFIGFQEQMVSSVKAYRKMNNLNDTPFGDRDWKENLTFQKYFDWYAPELNASYQSQNAKLLTWVDRANQNGKIMRIFAAEDDWLNEPDAWVPFSVDNLLTVNKGGHYGFHHLKWYDNFITKLFSIPISIATVGGVL